MSLRKAAFVGVRWTTFSSTTRSILQLLQIAILARWLAPEDFGVVALVVAIAAFLQIFADMGMSNALIHHQNVTQNELSSLFWVSVAVSALLACLLAFSAATVADWYRQSVLKSLLYLAALTLIVNSLGQQLRVMAQKALRFRGLACVEVTAAVAGFTAAVIVAALGGGAYSLLAGSLVGAGAASLLTWLWLADGWRPRARVCFAEIRRFLQFGAYMIGNNIVSTFNMQADVLIGGRLLGVQSIGLYSVSKSLSLRVSEVINPVITRVGMPVMAKGQADTLLLKKIYLQTVRMTASVNFPIYAALALYAEEFVSLLLGEQWRDAVDLVRVLACWALVRSVGNPVGSLLMALGRADLSFNWNVAWLLVTLPAVWVGSQFGATGLAWSVTGLVVIGFVPNWYFLVRPLCGADFLEYSMQAAIPLLTALLSAVVSIVAVMTLTDDLMRIVTGLIVGGFTYGVLSWMFNRIWVDALLELFLGARNR